MARVISAGHAPGWANARVGVAELRQGLAAFASWEKSLRRSSKACSPKSKPRAEDAGRNFDSDRRSAGACGRDGRAWTDAFLHRIRGEILLKRDPANTAPAEEAFLTAIAVANSKRRGVSSCGRRFAGEALSDPTAPPTPMPCSHPRSKAFRRRRNSRRSQKRRRCSPRLRRAMT